MPEHTVPVLTKAIAVLRMIAEGREDTTTKALAHALGLSPSTVYRVLQTYMAEGWVRAVPGGRHELSLGLLPLLQPLARHDLLIDAARPHLAKLAGATRLAAKLSVRQGVQALSLARAESPLETAVSVRVGSAFHLALGSSGAVLLSEMTPAERARIIDDAPRACWEHQTRADVEKRIADCRRAGVCSDFGGYRPGVHAMSAPLRDRSGAIAGVFTIVGFSQDFDGRKGTALSRALVAAARECGRTLAGTPALEAVA